MVHPRYRKKYEAALFINTATFYQPFHAVSSDRVTSYLRYLNVAAGFSLRVFVVFNAVQTQAKACDY